MKNIFLLFLCSFYFYSYAQEKKCGNFHKANILDEKAIQNILQTQKTAKATARTGNIPFEVPVLFHIIHTNNANDAVNQLTTQQIDDQIKIINADFNRLHADTVNTPNEFKSVASSLNIQFILAQIDTNKVALKEKGIIRHYGFPNIRWQPTLFDKEVKPKTIRNPTQYLNIWIVEKLDSGLVGYAQFPDFSGLQGLPNQTGTELSDGIVIIANTMASLGGNIPLPLGSTYGRTLTHEIGHFLGLRHTFDDTQQNSCIDNDFCTDTPPLQHQTEGCRVQAQHLCTVTAMPQNFMDYTDDRCMNIFTQQQVERMQLVLHRCPRRKELSVSTATAEDNDFIGTTLQIMYQDQQLYLQTTNNWIEQVTITNLLGQAIFSSYYQNTTNTYINMNDYPNAMYLLQVLTPKGFIVKKILIRN
jgi:hypothetical protein